MERIKFNVLVGRTDSKGVFRFKNIGTAYENESNIKIVFDALPISNVNGQAIVYLKQKAETRPEWVEIEPGKLGDSNVSSEDEPEEVR